MSSPTANFGFDLKPVAQALSLPFKLGYNTLKAGASSILDTVQSLAKTQVIGNPSAIPRAPHNARALENWSGLIPSLVKQLSTRNKSSHPSATTKPPLKAKQLTDEFALKTNALKMLLAEFSNSSAETTGLDDILEKIQDNSPIKNSEISTSNPKSGNIEQLITQHYANDPISQAKMQQLIKLSQQIDRHIDPKTAPPTHHVQHSQAPSWLALMLDASNEPSHVEELYEMLSTLKNEGLSTLTEEFVSKAHEYADQDKAIEELAKETIFTNIPNTSAYMVADALATFLGVLSVVKGNQERKEANHILKHLKLEKTELKQQAEQIKKLIQSFKNKAIDPPAGLAFHQRLILSKLNRVRHETQTAKLDWKIAASAIGAGSTSALKGLLDISVKSAFAIKSLALGKGISGGALIAEKGTLAATAASAAGAISTALLGPAAGLFTLFLGKGFRDKTVANLKHLKQHAEPYIIGKNNQGELSLIQQVSLQHNPSLQENETFNNYKNFISNKAEANISFFTRFKKWNNGFLAGAGIYTASATAKAAVVVASILGAGAAVSNPVGWGVLTGVGVASAIVLGVATLGYIKNHIKQTQYSKQLSGDHKLVDRHFLVNAQNFDRPKKASTDSSSNGASSSNNQPQSFVPFHEGLMLAAQTLELFNHRETQLRTYLGQTAKDIHTPADHEAKPNVFQRMRGNTLGKSEFSQHTNTPENFKKLLENFVLPDLKKQSEHLGRKIAFRENIMDEHTISEDDLRNLGPDEDLQEALPAYQSHLDRTASKMRIDTHAQIEVDSLRQTVQAYIDSPQQDKITAMKTQLLKNWGAKVADKQDKPLESVKINKLFSQYMLKTLRKDVDMAKGILFQAQLQARIMRHLPVGEQTSASQSFMSRMKSFVGSTRGGKSVMYSPIPREEENSTGSSTSNSRVNTSTGESITPPRSEITEAQNTEPKDRFSKNTGWLNNPAFQRSFA